MAAPVIARVLLSALLRAAPHVASALITRRSQETPQSPPVTYHPAEGFSTPPVETANAQWKVPIVNSERGTFLATPVSEKEVRRANMETYSLEALKAAVSALPQQAYPVAGNSGTMLLRSGFAMDCEPGIDKEKMRNAMALTIMSDVVAACDVIIKHDPTPGTLMTKFLAEEIDNACLSDPACHERLRKHIFGELGANRGRIVGYERRVPRPLADRYSLDAVVLSDPTGHSSELFTNSRHERRNPRVTLLQQVPKYKVVTEAMNLMPRWNVVTPSLGRAGAQYSFDGQCCEPIAAFQTADRHLKDGEFYRTPTFVASVGDTDPGVYGQTRIDVLPFEITISNQNIPQRALISFVHEALHGYDELHKLGIGHDQLHSLAVYLTQEAVPAYLRLAQQLNVDTNGIHS